MNGCKNCKYIDASEDEPPCLECSHNHVDYWEPKDNTYGVTKQLNKWAEQIKEQKNE